MDAAAIGARRWAADSSNADLNGNTLEPPEPVPSGKRTTTEPPAIASRISFTTLLQCLLRQSSSQEMCAHNCRQRTNVEQREKVDRPEVAIDRRRPTDLCANCQIRAQQS